MDEGLPPEVRVAFTAIKREYTCMVAQGMSHEAITAAIRTWMHRAMAHAGAVWPAQQVEYALKLTLCLLEVNTPDQAQRLAALVRRSYECN
jgi:hypothetical protein